MGFNRTPPTDAPPAYRYVARFYRRSLRPVIIAMTFVTAIWALAWTVVSFKELDLANSDDFPKLAALAIAQGVLFAVACAFQIFGVVAASSQRIKLIKIYAFLCALAALFMFGVAIMRVVTHFVFKSDLIAECITVAETGSSDSVFGIWDSSPTGLLNETEAVEYCDSMWSRDSWAEIVGLILIMLLGLLFTSLAFAYYRQSLDPTSPANASRAPSNQVRRDGYPEHYNPPYDDTAYLPVYLPPPGPPPVDDGKPPEYKRSPYAPYVGDKSAKDDDPFSDYGGPSVPMPTHWVEDRDATAPSARV